MTTSPAGQSPPGSFDALASSVTSAAPDTLEVRATAFDQAAKALDTLAGDLDKWSRDLPHIPVLKPNEAMIEEAVALTGPRGRIGLIASFAPTFATMPPEFAAVAPEATLHTALAKGALDALNAGDPDGHDRAAAAAAPELAGCDVIALAQFSLARAAPAVAQASGKRVLTTPDSAVRKLQRLLLPAQAA